jgi:predicted phage terminase large subunit-like protein
VKQPSAAGQRNQASGQKEELAWKRDKRRASPPRQAATHFDLIAWSRFYLPEHFVRVPSKLHRWLARWLDRLNGRRPVKINLVGPRGGAKSTVATLAYVLRCALEAREAYIWIASDTRHQACAHLENIKAELVENDRLAAAYIDAFGRGPIWRASRIRLRNGVAIEAFGTGQRIRGYRDRANRPTLILCDDVQNDAHMESSHLRELSRRWFHGTLLGAGTKRTNVVHLATALHPDALAMQLLRTAGWESHLFAAVERWPVDMDLWQHWEAIYANLADHDSRRRARAFFDSRRSAMEDGALLLWPDEEDLYTLMCMQLESGRGAFLREKLSQPLLPELCEWPAAYFGPHIWFETLPLNLRVKTMALDPSKGRDDRRGDFAAYVMLAVDEHGLIYVEANLAREPTPEMVARGAELYARFRPDAFGVEANQFQELLASQFEEEFQRQGLIGITPWPIDNRVNKRVRIRRLGPYLASRRLRFKSESASTRLVVDQLREFPSAEHDDGPDALEMALRLALELLAPPQSFDDLSNRKSLF